MHLINFPDAVVNTTSEIVTGVDTSAIEQIGNLGIMLVISSVVVFFIVKVLSSLLEQNKITASSILPKVNELEDLVHSVKRDVQEAIQAHNQCSNRQFNEASVKIDAVYKSNVDIEEKFDHVVDSLNKVSVQLEVIQQFISHVVLDEPPEDKK